MLLLVVPAGKPSLQALAVYSLLAKAAWCCVWVAVGDLWGGPYACLK